jgi:hypothetical protein
MKELTPVQISKYLDKFTPIYINGKEVNPIPENTKVTVWCVGVNEEGFLTNVTKDKMGIPLFIAKRWILEEELQKLHQESELSNVIKVYKDVISRFKHSEHRVPYTYHHDYYRLYVDKIGLSRSEVAELFEGCSQEQLYAATLSYLTLNALHESIENLTENDLIICKKALVYTKKVFNQPI